MKKENRLNCVMLIDDDSATNFLHSHVLKNENFSENIIIRENGRDALNYLLHPDNENCETPDAIFLDLNMPLMDGWQFIEEYKNLFTEKKRNIKLFILTNSDNPDDIDRAKRIDEVAAYQRKPLLPNDLDELLLNYFPQRW